MTKIFKVSTLLLALTLVACSGKKKEENQAEEDTRISVKIAQVQSRSVDQISEYTGTIEPKIKNNIAPQNPVRISKIFVEIGDNVRKGQKLVQMDIANLQQLKLQLDNQTIDFNRLDELYKVGGISKSEWDSAKTALDVSKSNYENLLENTYLLSPINGVVSARNYDNGDLFNGATPILTVEQINPVKLLVNISESYYSMMKQNDKVDVKLDVYPNDIFTGNISLIYPTIDPTTRTFTVEISLPNNQAKIRPGMFARAIVNYGTQERVVVPDIAIVKQVGSGDRYVYVYKDGKVSYNKVVLGQRLGEEYELISGVENMDNVVVAGQSKLLDGSEVQIIQ